MDRLELNKKVRILLKEVAGLVPSPELRAKISKERILLTASISELRKDLECLPSLPAVEEDPARSPSVQLQRLKAEIAVWKSMEPAILHHDERDLKAAEWMEQLKECGQVVAAQRTAVQARMKQEVKWLEDVKQMKQALMERSGSRKLMKGSERSREARTVQQWQQTSRDLIAKIEWFVGDHLDPDSQKKRKAGQRKATSNKLSTSSQKAVAFIQELVSKVLDDPEDPYLEASAISKDWFLLFLRAGVIRTHPTNPSLVQLTPYHQ